MSTKANQDEQSLSQQNNSAGDPSLGAGSQPESKAPDQTAAENVNTNGTTDAEKIASAIDAVYKLNPALSIDEVTAIVASAFKKAADPVNQVDREAARIIPTVERDLKDKVYLKKDKKRQFPLDRAALNGVVVRQSYKKTTEEGDQISVPARNLNEIAIYTQEDFERMSQPGFGFEREGVVVEVWHEPGQTDTVQD